MLAGTASGSFFVIGQLLMPHTALCRLVYAMEARQLRHARLSFPTAVLASPYRLSIMSFRPWRIIQLIGMAQLRP